ncbi:ATP-binding protein [Streptomyces atacamensis]|uniref:ATP-binding protein n=1 Tax=Streptomyces atacamensis TaxID=531966 RepID=UPI00399CBDDC
MTYLSAAHLRPVPPVGIQAENPPATLADRVAHRRIARGRRWATAVNGRSDLSPGRARERARRACRRWSVPTGQTEAAVVIVSELVTNAVTHTRSTRVLVVMALADGRLTVSVSDQGPARPITVPVVEPDPEAEHGRGLWLVSLLADAVGHRATAAAGTRVWARLNLAGAV